VPQATLYRHIRAMSEFGILKVVEERPMRGATEKVYKIAMEQAHLSLDELAALTPEEHERLFSTFTAMLLSQFHNYIQQTKKDLVEDGVSYRTMPLYLSDPEFGEMMQEMAEIVKKRLKNEASPERRRRLLSLVIMPDVHSD
jgi:predicted transcriptional regulator